MPKPVNVCVFCGGGGIVKGHVTPEWFLDFLPNQADKHVAVQGLYRTFTPDPNKTTLFIVHKARQGRGAVKKLRKTCAKCDGGWMSVIEQAAKPSLSLLIQGVRTRLSVDDQKKIATLVALATIRNEFRDGKLAIPESDRRWIWEKRCPPPGWKIWIARFSGYDAKPFWANRSALLILPPETPQPLVPYYNTQSTTFVWGRICCVSFSSTFIPNAKAYDGQLRRIWPIEIDIFDSRRNVPRLNQADVAALGEALGKAYFG
jgi:hypothetical protein